MAFWCPLPATYAATNWPIRLAAIDSEGKHLAVAGRCGIAHYSLLTRKWKLFGNETQEKDMVVFGGLLWFARAWIVLGCFSIPTETDELRFYPKEPRLSNESMISVPVSGQVCLLENLRNRILTFTSDCRIYIYNVEETGSGGAQKCLLLMWKTLWAPSPPTLRSPTPSHTSTVAILWGTRYASVAAPISPTEQHGSTWWGCRVRWSWSPLL
ncbi:hypothetical protein WDU94_000082 [Cyamophila willieti]